MSIKAGNILNDLLSGQASSSKSGQVGSGINGLPDGATPFDQLMNLFGMVSLPTGIGSATDPSLSQFSELLGDKNKADGGSTPLAGTLLPNVMWGGGFMPLCPTKQTPGMAPGTSPDPTTLPSITPQSTSVKTGDTMLVPKEAVTTNPKLMALLNQTPVSVPQGKFAVVASKVTDGKLELEVASPKTSDQTIKITIPTALLHESATVAPSVAARIPLIEGNAGTSNFEQLLAHANVKEIEISTSAVAESILPSAPQTITIVAESNGRPVMLTGKMNKSQMTATTSRNTKDSALSALKSGSTPVAASDETNVVSPIEAKNPTASLANDSLTTRSFADFVQTLDSSAVKNDNFGRALPTGLERTEAPAQGVAVPVRPMVRMSIQDDLPRLSKLTGRTLTIKIEPEYLGPARLHLTMRQDTLSARLTVDSPQAKAAVESSLTQLTDQLSKAGIKVDYIDVGVRGGGAENQSFHRQSDWFRQQQPRHIPLAEISELTAETIPSLMSASRTSYLGNDRVNIFA